MGIVDWRWDQGRVLYFQFDVLKEISKVLVKYEGKNINDDSIAKELRETLKEEVGLPFLPYNYKINRNYSRVFQCSMLARMKGDKLFVSDICKHLATPESIISCSDDYFHEIMRRFRYPFPAFQEYDINTPIIYPFCAIIKYLISLKMVGSDAKVNIQTISSYIIGNGCSGLEDIDFYKNLKPTGYILEGDSIRQLREMLAFISQLSYLKAFNGYLYLDVLNEEELNDIIRSVSDPLIPSLLANKDEEFSQLTKVPVALKIPVKVKKKEESAQLSGLEIAEGKRFRVQHLRIERSPLLRKFYIQAHPEPVCAACELKVQEKYPWTSYLLDLHHLLPLASAIKVINENTSLDDLVGLCPSCHRAIHLYYNKWLRANNLNDFRSKKEAMEVYLEAVKSIA